MPERLSEIISDSQTVISFFFSAPPLLNQAADCFQEGSLDFEREQHLSFFFTDCSKTIIRPEKNNSNKKNPILTGAPQSEHLCSF